MLGWAALFKEFDTDGSGSTRAVLPSRVAPALRYTMPLQIIEPRRSGALLQNANLLCEGGSEKSKRIVHTVELR